MYNYFLNTIPPHTNDLIKYYLTPSNNKYPLHLKAKKKILVTLCADYGNMGDIAIAYAQLDFLKKHFPDYIVITSLISNVYEDMKSLKAIVNNDDIITIIGGGNNGSLYPGIEFCRMFVISQFKHNKIISFPQTLVLGDTIIGRKIYKKMKKVYASNPGLILTAREEHTFEEYSKRFSNQVILTPDIVLSYRPKIQNNKRNGILLCLRNDSEKKSPSSFNNVLSNALTPCFDTTFLDTVNDRIYTNYEDAISDMLDIIGKFSQSQIVITDRLHGMIFSYITGTPCIVMPSLSPKTEYSYNFIKDCEYVRFCASFDIGEILKLITKLPYLSKNSPADMSKAFEPLVNSLKALI